MKIQVAGPGCARCEATEKNVVEACNQLGLDAEVTHVRDMLQIAKLGVRMTPAVVVDGKVVVAGKIPTVDDLKGILAGKR
jgi:small redox-active disulfide protein 2